MNNIECPSCGHELSMWTPPEPTRTELGAMWVADHVTSWRFPAAVALLIAAWTLLNVWWQPFDPYPVIIFAVISAVLATMAALQAPLILTAQRQSADHDRQRDDETLRVASNAEADIHDLNDKLDRLIDLVADRADG